MMDKIVQAMIDEKLNNLHTALICKIVKIDIEKMMADVKPLNKKKFKGQEPIDLPLIQNVPVALPNTKDFYIRLPYKVDDIVVVVFSERRVDEIMNFGKDVASGKRKHSLDDGIIIAGINLFSNSLSSEHKNDLLIQNKNNNSKIVMKPSGEVIVEADLIKLGQNAEQGIPLGSDLKQWLDNHTHPYSWSDSAGSGTSSPPTEESPEPSEKAVVE